MSYQTGDYLRIYEESNTQEDNILLQTEVPRFEDHKCLEIRCAEGDDFSLVRLTLPQVKNMVEFLKGFLDKHAEQL